MVQDGGGGQHNKHQGDKHQDKKGKAICKYYMEGLDGLNSLKDCLGGSTDIGYTKLDN